MIKPYKWNLIQRDNERGFILLPSLIILMMISLLLMNWYQQEIQHRFQAQAFLRTQSIYQELNNASLWGMNLLQKYGQKELQQGSVVLKPSDFEPLSPQWSANVKPKGAFLKMKLIHNEDPTNPRTFDVLLSVENYNLTNYPWTQLNTSHFSLPQYIQLANEAVTLNRKNKRYWLKATNTDSFHHTFQGDTDLQWSQSQITIRQGQDEQTLDLKGAQTISIRVEGEARLEIDFEQITMQQVFIQTTQNMVLKLSEENGSFSESAPLFFADIAGNLMIERKEGTTHNVQIKGYFKMGGESCLQIDSSLSQVNWQGSITCVRTPTPQTTPIYLQSKSYGGEVPSSFNLSYLQFNGVKLEAL